MQIEELALTESGDILLGPGDHQALVLQTHVPSGRRLSQEVCPSQEAKGTEAVVASDDDHI